MTLALVALDFIFLVVYFLFNIYFLHRITEIKLKGDYSQVGVVIYLAVVGFILFTTIVLYLTQGIGA